MSSSKQFQGYSFTGLHLRENLLSAAGVPTLHRTGARRAADSRLSEEDPLPSPPSPSLRRPVDEQVISGSPSGDLRGSSITDEQSGDGAPSPEQLQRVRIIMQSNTSLQELSQALSVSIRTMGGHTAGMHPSSSPLNDFTMRRLLGRLAWGDVGRSAAEETAEDVVASAAYQLGRWQASLNCLLDRWEVRINEFTPVALHCLHVCLHVCSWVCLKMTI